MNNSLQVFSNQDFTVRTFTDENGDVWFVAKDVAEALEYSRFDSNLLLNIPEIWKGTKRIRTPGGEQEMLCLTEQGLYFFLGRSDKPKALQYQMWIAGEVVPSIRTTGSYSMPKVRKAVKNNADTSLPEHSGSVKAAERILHKVFRCKKDEDFQEVIALDDAFKQSFGMSLLETQGFKLVKKTITVEKRISMSNGFAYIDEQREIFAWEHKYDLDRIVATNSSREFDWE